MIRTLCLLGLTGALVTVAVGQTVGDRRPAERSVGETQTTVSLSNDADIRRHYNELQRTLRQLNADELEQLYDEYRAARAAISDENAQLAARLIRENNEAHGALREQNLDNTERSQRTREIQEGFAAATAERQAQYLEEIDKLESRYASDRAERRTLLDREISLLQVQTSEALARLQAGARSVTAPARVMLPQVAGSVAGSSVRGGGIDLGGTVPLESPGDEIVARDPERQQMNERLYQAELERRRQAEEEATSSIEELATSREEARNRMATLLRMRSNEQIQQDCSTYPDADGDGVIAAACGGADCDDSDPNRYPGNTEVADARGHDEDCDLSTLGNLDEDGDGYVSAWACNVDGYDPVCGTDCNDNRASVYPGAAEVCNYVDDNCDGHADEGTLATKFLDRDGDLHGDPGRSLFVCAQTSQSSGDATWLSTVGNDCDDTNPTIWQGCEAPQ